MQITIPTMRPRKAIPPTAAPTTSPIEGDPVLLPFSSREAPGVPVSVGNETDVLSKDPVGNGNWSVPAEVTEVRKPLGVGGPRLV
jgi:hypothetical protein